MNMEVFVIMMSILFGGLILMIIVGSWGSEEWYIKKHGSGNSWYRRADELPQLETHIDFDKHRKEHCEHCRFYDGYDVCTHPNQFGTVIQNSVDYCEFYKRYKQ